MMPTTQLIYQARKLLDECTVTRTGANSGQFVYTDSQVIEMAELLENMAEELERVYKDTCRKGAALKSKSSFPPIFISGDGLPDEVLMLQNAAVSQLSEGAESRWGADYPALARAAYEAGWDDAMMYCDQYGSSHDRERNAGID